MDFLADKAKRFLAEFYTDGDEGKVFKYGEQLVRSCSSCMLVYNKFPRSYSERGHANLH